MTHNFGMVCKKINIMLIRPKLAFFYFNKKLKYSLRNT